MGCRAEHVDSLSCPGFALVRRLCPVKEIFQDLGLLFVELKSLIACRGGDLLLKSLELGQSLLNEIADDR